MKNFINLIKESFQIYKSKWKSLLLLSVLNAFVTILLQIGIYITIRIFMGSAMAIGLSESTPISLMGVIILLVPWVFLLIPVSFIIFFHVGTIIVIMNPKNTQLKEVFRSVKRHYWRVLGVTGLLFLLSIMIMVLNYIFISYSFFFITISDIVHTLYMLCAGFFSIIVFLTLSVYSMFSFYISIDEERKGIDALKRSWNLVRGNWWKVFSKFALLSIIIFLIVGINWLRPVNFFPFNIIGSISIVPFLVFIVPFMIIFGYLMYLDLKKSKEIQTTIPSIEEKVSI